MCIDEEAKEAFPAFSEALLRHGTVVALWCPGSFEGFFFKFQCVLVFAGASQPRNEPHHRFMRMNAHNGHMDGSPRHGETSSQESPEVSGLRSSNPLNHSTVFSPPFMNSRAWLQ